MSRSFVFLNPARELLFKEGKPSEAFILLEPMLAQPRDTSEKRALYELAALALRAQSKFSEAVKLYVKIGDDYQAGYCELLAGNNEAIRPYWLNAVQKRQNHWCLSFYGMVMRQLNSIPTTFQIRNHMESDIANLIKAYRYDLIENLLSYADFLVQVNLETYKFIGRALMNNGWTERAGHFLKEGQRVLPNDPEIYFHLGQYAIIQGMHGDARVMLNQCLLISPTYSPAKELLEGLPAGS